MTPQVGDFQLVPIGWPTGPLIELGQYLNGSGFVAFEHARVYIGRGNFVEAEPHGARVASHPLTDGVWSTGIVPLSADQRVAVATAAIRYARQQVPYSGLDYLALALHRLRVPAPGLQPYIASTGHMICSQLVDQCYLDAGVHLFCDGRWPGYVTPADLYGLLKAAKQ